MHVLLRATILLLLCVTTTRAENWPRFRGPNGAGVSTLKSLPTEWSASKNIAWKTPIAGEGWSSPVVWNDHIFLTSATDSGTKAHVIALDRASGKILWDRPVFDIKPLRKENKNSWATPTPVTDGERVVAVFGDGSIVALDFAGKVLWTNRDVKFYSRHGLGASPVIYKNLVIMPFDGSKPVDAAGKYPKVSEQERTGWQIPWEEAFIAALDLTTGKRVWTAKRGLSRIAHVTPIFAKIDGEEQLISGAGDRIQGFNPATGDLLWSVYAQGEGVTPSPVLGDGRLFASSGFEKTTLRAVKLGGAKGDVTSSHVAWEQRRGCPTQPSPIYLDGRLYASTDIGVVSCYQPDTGEVLWQGRIGGNHCASPIAADGRLYFLAENGDATIIKAGEKFESLAKNSIGERCQASIVPIEHGLIIRGERHVYCIGKSE